MRTVIGDLVSSIRPVGRRQRRREQRTIPGNGPNVSGNGFSAPTSDYPDAEGNVLILRGSLTPKARREYAAVLAGGLEREDAWQRAIELLFERLTVSWTIAGLQLSAQRELIGRYRMASGEERRFVRDVLREHVREHFPELQAP